MGRLLAAILTSAIIGQWATDGALMLFVEHQDLINQFFGLSQDFLEAIAAIMLAGIAMAIGFTSFSFGCLKAFFAGPNNWRWYVAVSCLALLMYRLGDFVRTSDSIDFSLLGEALGQIGSGFKNDFTLDLLPGVLGLCAVTILLVVCSMATGEILAKLLLARVKPLIS
jgi:hypothetical protein